MSTYVSLQGQKLLLRDMKKTDIKKIYFNNYESPDREHLKWNGPYKTVEPISYSQFFDKERKYLEAVGTDKPRSRLIIEIDGELRGTVGRYWVSEETNWLEIGIVIFDSSYWSGGYGTEAFLMWMNYLFNHLETVRLGISTWSGNERMIKLAEKCGMVEEGRIRKARIVRDEYFDAIKMGILRQEWMALNGQHCEEIRGLRNKKTPW